MKSRWSGRAMRVEVPSLGHLTNMRNGWVKVNVCLAHNIMSGSMRKHHLMMNMRNKTQFLIQFI